MARRRSRGGSGHSGCRADDDDDSQPESVVGPEYRVTVTSVARNGESLERGRLHEESDEDDDEHRSKVEILSNSNF